MAGDYSGEFPDPQVEMKINYMGNFMSSVKKPGNRNINDGSLFWANLIGSMGGRLLASGAEDRKEGVFCGRVS